MQSNEITLQVNHDNDDGTTAEITTTFERYEDTEVPNRSTYTGSGHTPAMRNQLNFYRTPETPSGDFAGQRKSAFKLTRDITVPDANNIGTKKAADIGTVSFSHAVGSTLAERKQQRMEMVALLLDDVIMEKLYDGLHI